MAYTKLWHRIVTSSIWDADNETRIVWITMLALANQHGYVQSSFKSLAILSRVSEDACKRALSLLSSPDPDSRTKTDDGRRIEVVDGGWNILNYELYRNALKDDPHSVANRERQRKHRQQHTVTLCHVTSRDTASASVSSSSSLSSGGSGGCAPEDIWSLEQILDTAYHPTVAMGKAMAEDYFHWRNKTGWLDGKGRPVARTISSLRSDMIRYKVDSPSWKDKEKARERGMSLGTGGL